MQVLQQVLRQLVKSPGFTLAAVVILALGIGVNTAIFSVVEAALLRPLPFPHPDRLVRLYEAYDQPDSRANTLNLSEQTVQQWREHGKDVFSGIGAGTGASLSLDGEAGEAPRYLPAAQITANFFEVLGISPLIGRNFTPAEDRPNGPRVVIIGYDLWQRQFGGRTNILGATIRLDGVPRTVIGVMPPNFRHPYRAEAWIPLAVAFDSRVNPYHYLYGVARLQPGVSVAAADAAVRRLCANIIAAAPNPANPTRAYIRTLRSGFIADLEPKLLAIYGAAMCAFLVAAANFAGLLMSRAVEREGDAAIRAALGASRWRLVREALLQSLVLAALGTAFGLLLAAWITPVLVALSPEGSDATGSAMREFDYAVRLNLPVFGFATLALLLVGLGFGLLPAWRAARADLRSAMGSGSRSATLDRGTRRVLSGLVVGEIAAALVLLVGAGLLAGHFRALVNRPWGFATDHRLTFQLSVARLIPTSEARVRLLDRALAELRTLPGVRSATVTVPHPLNAARELVSNNPEGAAPPEPRGYELAYLRASAPGYFATVGQTLIRGRDFTADDTAASPPVCIVNESMARRYWPGQDAVGKRVKWGRLDSSRPWLTVVGVAADTRVVADPNDGSINGTLCLPVAQAIAATLDLNEFTFVVETTVPPLSLENAARVAIARADPRVAIYNVGTVADLANESWVTERFAMALVSMFGALGLVLAAVGLYGLLALQVARRRREFGVRLALGSTAAGLVRLVATQGLCLLGAGLLMGGFLAWAAVSLARSAWPELPAASLTLFATAAFVLTAAVVFACWLPARRATKVDPLIALRSE